VTSGVCLISGWSITGRWPVWLERFDWPYPKLYPRSRTPNNLFGEPKTTREGFRLMVRFWFRVKTFCSTFRQKKVLCSVSKSVCSRACSHYFEIFTKASRCANLAAHLLRARASCLAASSSSTTNHPILGPSFRQSLHKPPLVPGATRHLPTHSTA
jgi:hypothetical protein